MKASRVLIVVAIATLVTGTGVITSGLARERNAAIEQRKTWQQNYCFMNAIHLKDFVRGRLFSSKDARMAASPWIHAHFLYCSQATIADRAIVLLQAMRETDDMQIARDTARELEALDAESDNP